MEHNQYLQRSNRVKSWFILITVLIIILLTILLTGCSHTTNFDNYRDVTIYCYNQTLSGNCALEKCIMLNSAQFTESIKFTAEKNYLQCELQHCGGTK